jgi:DNA-binding response OmpR family regulator
MPGAALLLEDEALIALDVAESLDAEGFVVATVDSCASALAWLAKNEDPAIAVIDVELRDGSCERVAEVLIERGIPHIIHAAGLLKATPPFDRGLWLPKPTSSQAFMAAIRTALATSSKLANQ